MKIFITGLIYNSVSGENFTIKEDSSHIKVTGNTITFTFNRPESGQIGNAIMIDFNTANVNSVEDYVELWKNCKRDCNEVILRWLECTDVPYVVGQKENVWTDMEALVSGSDVFSLKDYCLIFDRPSARLKRNLRFLIAIEPIDDSCKVLFIHAEQKIINENCVEFTVNSVKSVEKENAGDIEKHLFDLNKEPFNKDQIDEYYTLLNTAPGTDEMKKLQFEKSKYIVEYNQ